MSNVTAECLSDSERRELDCWIATNIEQLAVLHDPIGIEDGSFIRLSDPAYMEFRVLHPNHKPNPSGGPFPVAYYSFNPVIALNCFQDTEYADGWSFTRIDGQWHGMSDGLVIEPTKSLALSLMMALKHEYEYQNDKEKT